MDNPERINRKRLRRGKVRRLQRGLVIRRTVESGDVIEGTVVPNWPTFGELVLNVPLLAGL